MISRVISVNKNIFLHLIDSFFQLKLILQVSSLCAGLVHQHRHRPVEGPELLHLLRGLRSFQVGRTLWRHLQCCTPWPAGAVEALRGKEKARFWTALWTSLWKWVKLKSIMDNTSHPLMTRWSDTTYFILLCTIEIDSILLKIHL